MKFFIRKGSFDGWPNNRYGLYYYLTLAKEPRMALNMVYCQNYQQIKKAKIEYEYRYKNYKEILDI